MTKKHHVATSPITGRIYAGTVLKNGIEWGANKTDVTGEACAAVAHHVLCGKKSQGSTIVTVNGVAGYEITVKALPGADHK